MRETATARRMAMAVNLLFCWMTICLAAMVWLSVHTLRGIQRDQQAHAQSFVPAKRLAAKFEREILNARIFFIYFVTIQKPNSLESGWARYHNAEAAVRDLVLLVNQQEDLKNLRVPAAKLQADIDTYGVTLAQVLSMVQGGELKGPHYDAMVKLWAAKGAVMVGDAGTFESLCFRSGEANSTDITTALGSGQTHAEIFLGACVLLSLALTMWLNLRIRSLLPSDGTYGEQTRSAPATPGLERA